MKSQNIKKSLHQTTMDENVVFIHTLHGSKLFLDRFEMDEFPYPPTTLQRIVWRMRVLDKDEDNAISEVVCASQPSLSE
jgi:hypothetical protein